MQAAAAIGKSLGSFRFDVSGVEAVAGASLALELRPELADFQSFGHAAPELPQPPGERQRLNRRLLGEGGGHEGQQ